MIKDNVIYFGYGDVLVKTFNTNGGYSNYLGFIEIEPPKQIGEKPEIGSYEIVKKIDFSLNENDYHVLSELDRVKARKINQIAFRDYILDFSEYNIKSVEIVERGFKKALTLISLSFAC